MCLLMTAYVGAMVVGCGVGDVGLFVPAPQLSATSKGSSKISRIISGNSLFLLMSPPLKMGFHMSIQDSGVTVFHRFPTAIINRCSLAVKTEGH